MTFTTRLLLAACLLTSTALWAPLNAGAATGPALAAANENGRITRLDLKTGELVVGDTLFKLANQVAVYDARGLPTSTKSLKKGLHIAFNIVRDTLGSSYISAIWILPAQ
ncbi:MAG: hypothetical protein ACE5FE_04865 [Acidiferrobacterales bacterium]